MFIKACPLRAGLQVPDCLRAPNDGGKAILWEYPPPVPSVSGTGSVAGAATGIVEQGNNAGSSCYESLNIRLQKPFTRGLTQMNNFLWKVDRPARLSEPQQSRA